MAVAFTGLAIVLSQDSDCPPTRSLSGDAESMQAIVYRCYGPSGVLQLEKIKKPLPAANEVLVRVRAAAVNPLDWHYMRGTPYFMRLASGIGAPADIRLGVDFAGTIEAVGTSVQHFSPGDRVFGGRTGAFAEYVTVAEDRAISPIPPGVTFEQAASVPIAAQLRKDDLATVATLIETGRVTPVIDRTFSLGDVPAAIEYSESGRARGKIIVSVDSSDGAEADGT